MQKMTFKVRVHTSEGAFLSNVYAVQGNDFLLYHKVTGFGWYHFDAIVDGKPAIELVEEDGI